MQSRYLLFLLCLASTFTLQAQSSFSIEDAINYANRESDALKLNALEVQEAAESIREFKSIGLPKVDANLNYQYNFIKNKSVITDFISPAVYGVLFNEGVLEERDLGPPASNEITFMTNNFLSMGVEASSLLFDGSYLVGLKAAKSYKDLIAKNENITKQEIRTQITKAYLAVLIVDENLEILAKNLKNLDKVHREAKAYYESGFVESIDVSRIELSQENIANEKSKLLQLRDLNMNVLKFQMNYLEKDDLVLTDELETIIEKINLDELNLLSEIDFNNRAEYDLLLSTQEINKLDLERIEKGKYPSLIARAGLSGALQRDNLFSGSEPGILPAAYGALGLNLPIYDGNERSAQAQIRKIKIEKADIERQQFEKSVKLQVQNARARLVNAKQNIENAKRTLAIIEDIYNKTNIKYGEGVGSSVELTQAEAQLYQEQSKYINALYELILAKTELDIALGTL